MAIISLTTAQPTGLASVEPHVIYILTTNTYAEVTATGYLTQAKQEGFNFSNQEMALVYTTDEGPVWLKVVVTYSNASILSTVVSLVQVSSPGDVVLPTIANNLIVSTDTAGTLGNITGTAINRGPIQSGLVAGGFAGSLAAYPTTTLSGFLALTPTVNASGNFSTTITNAAAIGQSQVISIPDALAATASVVVSTAAIRMKRVVAAAAAGGAAAQSFADPFCTAISVVIGNWVTQTNPASILTIVPGAGSFVVTSSADVGVGTFSYIISK